MCRPPECGNNIAIPLAKIVELFLIRMWNGVADDPETTSYRNADGSPATCVTIEAIRLNASLDGPSDSNREMIMNRFGRLLFGLTTAIAFVLVSGCSSALPNRDPTGDVFPPVVGESLEKERVELPAALAGQPAILLIGYDQGTQFDIDRWLMGLIQAGADVRILEIPTIPGLVPSLASGWIDEGMRSGIPKEDWGVVVTLYGSAATPVAKLTGTTNGRLTRVIGLDADGRIAWFDDKGYSARKAMQLVDFLGELKVPQT